MSVGSDLQKMGCFLEGLEGGVGTVNSVEFLERIDAETGPTVEIEIAISPSADRQRMELSPTETTIDAEGRVRIGMETADPVVPQSGDEIDVEPTGTTIDADGTVTVRARASVGDEEESTEIATGDEKTEIATDGEETETDNGRNVPPFRDPDLLADVYESCDTFAEMSEAIEMDVTGETVRRYMIDYGIHEPNPYGGPTEGDERSDIGSADETDVGAESNAERESEPDSGDDSMEVDGDDQQSPIVVTDGIGVHKDVTVDTLVEAISRSNTVYEVKREIGLDREETRELLRKHDLIDLVAGRLATEHEREIDRETILERLRTAAEIDSRRSVASS